MTHNVGRDPSSIQTTSSENVVSQSKPRLLEQVRGAIRIRHYSRRTEAAYVGWIRRFILFHGKLLTGEVTHVNILAGRENHSAMYVAPRLLAGFHGEPGGGSLIQQNKIFSPFLLAFFFF